MAVSNGVNGGSSDVAVNMAVAGSEICEQRTVEPTKSARELELERMIAQLKQDNKRLQDLRTKGVTLKVATESKALSAYGLNRFPITLYKEQWLKLLDMADDIRAFIKENDGELASKLDKK